MFVATGHIRFQSRFAPANLAIESNGPESAHYIVRTVSGSGAARQVRNAVVMTVVDAV
jgi:hypothetical protein